MTMTSPTDAPDLRVRQAATGTPPNQAGSRSEPASR